MKHLRLNLFLLLLMTSVGLVNAGSKYVGIYPNECMTMVCIQNSEVVNIDILLEGISSRTIRYRPCGRNGGLLSIEKENVLSIEGIDGTTYYNSASYSYSNEKTRIDWLNILEFLAYLVGLLSLVFGTIYGVSYY